MRMNKFYMPTLKEVPADAEIPSHQLLLRAGMIRKSASGIYSYLPLGYRVVQKVERIVREEMDRAGSQEIRMSVLQPRQIWEESGRWSTFGPEMFKLTDRHDQDFCLGPTAEEYFTDLVHEELRSYKQLPLNLYQIQWKYRDEKRPRFGINRSREFLMKDAYSFDKDREGMERSYQAMWEAYVRVFDRLGLDYRVVLGDSGAMGGNLSHEFTALSEVGEGVIVYCPNCDYAATDEKATCLGADADDTGVAGADGTVAGAGADDGTPAGVDGAGVAGADGAGADSDAEAAPLEEVATPEVRTIEDLTAFLGISAQHLAKAVCLRVKDEPVFVFLPGDRELNLAKLVAYLGIPEHEIEMLDDETIQKITGAEAGFTGPCGLADQARVILDAAMTRQESWVCGANKTDFHLKNARYGRDFTGEVAPDLQMVKEGDRCPHCGAPLDFARGIEVGNIFQLGTKYSEPLGATFLDEDGKAKPLVMGSYGIGITRTVSAIVEQNHDEAGIIWPLAAAPYQAIVTVVNSKQADQMDLAEQIYQDLEAQGVETLLDDRAERAGVKFNDRDLIGIPLRITVGKRASEGWVEYSRRVDRKNEDLPVEEAKARVLEAIQQEEKR